MNPLIAFDFEAKSIRVVMDDRGEPWFVAADVLESLTLDRKALERLDADEKGVNSIHTPGGFQEMTMVSESGLYNLALGSRKPEAKRFKRWVTHEVLPALRKTGTYSLHAAALPPPAQDRVHAILLIGEAIAKVPGVKPGMAMAAALTAIHENTGIGIESLRKVLPAANEPMASLNPTQFSKELGLSARQVNVRLQSLGLQFRNDRDEWELTEAGQHCAEALPYSRNGHSGYQILWRPDVIDLLREAA